MHNDSQSMCVANGYDTLYLCSYLLKPTSPQPPPGQIQIGDNTAAPPVQTITPQAQVVRTLKYCVNQILLNL